MNRSHSLLFRAASAGLALTLGIAHAPHLARAQPAEPSGGDANGEPASNHKVEAAETTDVETADVEAGAKAELAPAKGEATATAEPGPGAAPAVAGRQAAPAPPESKPVAPGASRCREAPIHAGDHPEFKDHGCLAHRLEWDGGFLYGGLEMDAGYARYEFPDNQTKPYETANDLRGRFVVGPMLSHPFGSSGYFVRATGQVVAWLREKSNTYQINADDVWGQFGKTGVWDVQVGRFMTWRVYHKGLGYDLYTLEDNGAEINAGFANASYAVHTYEVDYIFLRNSPYVGGEVAGRAALHYYPARFLGFELAAAYGLAQNESSNTLGGRFAADFHVRHLRASFGAEYRVQNSMAPSHEPDATMAYVKCANCGQTDNKGIGGGLIFTAGPVELGGGLAKGWDGAYLGLGQGTGRAQRDIVNSGTRLSYGGYLQCDLGTPLFQRALILGAGVNQTDFILENHDAQYHLQGAAYLAFPLGVNDSMLKLVVSHATADLYDATNAEGSMFLLSKPTMTAARLRFTYAF